MAFGPKRVVNERKISLTSKGAMVSCIRWYTLPFFLGHSLAYKEPRESVPSWKAMVLRSKPMPMEAGPS